MKECYDFLILYEVKNRELENVCLIKYELEKRGYRVKVQNTWNMRDELCDIDAKVVLTPWLYGTREVYFAMTCARNIKAIVNLQWEQIYSNYEAKSRTNKYMISGIAKQCIHLSWGPYNHKRLTEFIGINDKYVKKVGHVGLDFLKTPLSSYYLSRKQLCRKYNIDSSQIICLFISSFRYVNLPQHVVSSLNKKISMDLSEFIAIAKTSQSVILGWIDEYLSNNKDVTFIYRPHPAEVENTLLNDMIKKHSNFKVIVECSVKQWILCSDMIYTWYSTAIAEIETAKKRYAILRPCKIPIESEIVYCTDCKNIETYNQFINSITTKVCDSPVSRAILEQFYTLSDNVMTYKKICDVLEDAYRSKEYNNVLSRFKVRYLFMRMRLLLRNQELFYKYVYQIVKRLSPSYYKKKTYKRSNYEAVMRDRNYASLKEIDSIIKKISNVIID